MSQPSSRNTLLAAIGLLALFGAAAPTPARAATPTPSAPPAGYATGSSKPGLMKVAGDALGNSPSPSPAARRAAAPAAVTPLQARPAATLNREVFGFAQAGALADPSAGYQSWNFGLLSTVAYFGLHVNASDGSLVTNDTGWNVWNSPPLTDLVNRAHAAGVRVVLTVIYQDAGPGMCTALANADRTVSDTVAQVSQKGVDGVNIDYEGSAATCPASNGKLTSFVQKMRAALGPGRHLTVDTYGGSAAPGGDGFFDLPGMAPYVNAFFVMAYELDNSNWSSIGCSSYCLSPTSPFSGPYRWNDSSIADQYSAAVGAAKTILGLPYYGWAACVTSAGENAYPTATPHWVANTQLGIRGVDVGPQHTDSHDGVDHWYTFQSSTYGCTRELYIDDAGTLAAKYQLVISKGLLGAGIWSLDMGGGLADLWNALATRFSLTPTAPASVTACAGQGSVYVGWPASTAAGGPITQYTVTAYSGGTGVASLTVPGSQTAVSFTNLTPGTAYTFRVTATNAYGTGPASDPSAPTAPVASASSSYFSWYDLASPGMAGDNIHIVNPGGTTDTGCVYVAGVAVGSFSVAAQGQTYLSMGPGVIGGPVVVTTSSGGTPVLATQRVQYYQSFNETAARDAGKASQTLYIPWYDRASPGMWNDNIHVINPSPTQTAHVTISGPGPTLAVDVAPGGESYQSWPAGTIGGPVVISSSTPVLASQRVQYYGTFNEVPARSSLEASPVSYFSWADHASPGMVNDNIHLVNPSGSAVSGTVTIGAPGATIYTVGFSVPAGGQTYVTVPQGVIGGPVRVAASAPLLASQRVQYYGSFNEVASAAGGGAGIWFPWYDRASPGMWNDNVHVINPGSAPAQVSISGPGPTIQLQVAPGGEAYVSWPQGAIGGPVHVTSTGSSVIASQRVQFYNTFNEAGGLA